MYVSTIVCVYIEMCISSDKRDTLLSLEEIPPITTGSLNKLQISLFLQPRALLTLS